MSGKLIPNSDRSSFYVAIDDKRCSFSTAGIEGGGNPYHAWYNRLLSNPYRAGTNSTVAILYNPDYLILNGNDTVIIQPGSQYREAEYTTPDGADVASNATDLDTAVPGTYKIQYTATKGCGALDAFIQTVEVDNDTAKPSFASAALDRDTRELAITFDEAIDVSAADLTKIYASDAGQANEVSLAGADFNSTAPDSDTISMTLSRAQLDLIIAMAAPQLDIEAGAVSDRFGNAIDDAPDNLIFIAGADNVLWNATITAGYDRNDQATGWDSRTELGSIAYNAPALNGTFHLHGTAYTVRTLYHAEESDPGINRLGLDSHIPQSERSLVHLAIGDARCSIESAEAADGPTSFHLWDDAVLPKPFSNGTNTTAAILYNSNYLKLNGADAATVRQGDSYRDAGAETPDGATVRSNATDLDTSVPGTFEIHYNATKGCGELDSAIRTVEVTEATTVDENVQFRTLLAGLAL